MSSLITPQFHINDTITQTISRLFPTWNIQTLSYQELTQRLPDFDVIITWKFEQHLYQQTTRLRRIYTPAAGHDWVHPDPKGIVSVQYGTFHGSLIAESLLAMILYFSLDFGTTLQNQRKQEWSQKLKPRRLLQKQQVLFIGYGHIGRVCAQMLSHHGMGLHGTQRNPTQSFDSENGVQIYPFSQLTRILPKMDHVVVLLPNHETTRGILDREVLQCFAPHSYLYNFGRGTVIPEEDLVGALQSGHIAGAGLDVFETEPLPSSSKLWNLPNVILTPHSSCFYDEYGALYAKELEELLRKDFG